MQATIHTLVASDRLVAHGGAAFVGGELVATSGGAAQVLIRDGVDANGEAVAQFDALTSATQRFTLDQPIIMRQGIFVDLGSNVSRFELYYLMGPEG